MIDGDPDDSPEYFAAKERWTEFWRRVNEGLETGVDDDPDVAFASLVRRFGPHNALEAVDRHIENLGVNFESRWRDIRRAREEGERRARNPYGAGRKAMRSDVALLHAWLTVKICMKADGLSAVRACKKLTTPPSRRDKVQWPGLLLEYNYTAPDARSGSYYVKTPETLRDIYNDAVARYRKGPETLRSHWRSLLEGFAR